MMVLALNLNIVRSYGSPFASPYFLLINIEFTFKIWHTLFDTILDISKESIRFVRGIQARSQHHVASSSTEAVEMSVKRSLRTFP